MKKNFEKKTARIILAKLTKHFVYFDIELNGKNEFGFC